MSKNETKRKSRKRKPGQRPGSAVTFERVRAFALTLPGVKAATAYGTPAVKLNGQLICRLRSEVDGSVALRCDFIERQRLLQSNPGAFYINDHYLNFPIVAVRLKKVSFKFMKELVVSAFRLVATPKLRARYEASPKKIRIDSTRRR